MKFPASLSTAQTKARRIFCLRQASSLRLQLRTRSALSGTPSLPVCSIESVILSRWGRASSECGRLRRRRTSPRRHLRSPGFSKSRSPATPPHRLPQAMDKRLTSDRQAIETGEKKQAIAAYLKEHRRATTAEVASLLGLSNARVRSLLQKMAAEGVIEKIGNNRYAHCVLSQRDTSVG